MATRIFPDQVQNLQELEEVVGGPDGANCLLKMLAQVCSVDLCKEYLCLSIIISFSNGTSTPHIAYAAYLREFFFDVHTWRR